MKIKRELIVLSGIEIESVGTIRREIKNLDKAYIGLLSINETLQKENEMLEKALEIASSELFLFQSKLYSLEKEVCALGMANSIPFDLEAKYKEEWNDYLVTKAKEELEGDKNG